MKRRTLLKGAAASVSLMAAAVAGLLAPVRLLAADWPQTAFDSENVAAAIKDYFGDAPISDSDQVTIKAPLQAENGAVVPIKVTTSLANVESRLLNLFTSSEPRRTFMLANVKSV